MNNNIDATAINDSWNPILYNETGENTKIKMAAKHRELYGLCCRCKILAVINIVAIITARVTDGDNPVIRAYPQSNIIVIIYLRRRLPIIFNGNKNKLIINDIIPTCSPLNARMCASPDVENFNRCSVPSIDVSPVMVVFRNSIHCSDKGNEEIICVIFS